MNIMKYERYWTEVEPLAELIGVKLAPIEQILLVYPDECMGMEFDKEENDGAPLARVKYSQRTQEQLVKSFRSHEWKIYSDIYGHNGLTCGGSCKKCGYKFKFPEPPSRSNLQGITDNFILAYHYIYGRQKRFGGRITKCKGKK